jgi:hypothetical protein
MVSGDGLLVGPSALRLGSGVLQQECSQLIPLRHNEVTAKGRALPAFIHSYERQAGQGHVHEAIVTAEALCAGLVPD